MQSQMQELSKLGEVWGVFSRMLAAVCGLFLYVSQCCVWVSLLGLKD